MKKGRKEGRQEEGDEGSFLYPSDPFLQSLGSLFLESLGIPRAPLFGIPRDPKQGVNKKKMDNGIQGDSKKSKKSE